MTSAELHALILREIAPLARAALDRQGELVGSNDQEFWKATGHYDGVATVRSRLMDLVDELEEQERSAVAG